MKVEAKPADRTLASVTQAQLGGDEATSEGTSKSLVTGDTATLCPALKPRLLSTGPQAHVSDV